MEISVQWKYTETRRAKMEVPDDATSEEILASSIKLATSGRAGKMDQILGSEVNNVNWTAPDGRFGGRL